MTQIIDEPTGLVCCKLKIEATNSDMIRVSILGQRDAEKAWVCISAEGLHDAVSREIYKS